MEPTASPTTPLTIEERLANLETSQESFGAALQSLIKGVRPLLMGHQAEVNEVLKSMPMPQMSYWVLDEDTTTASGATAAHGDYTYEINKGRVEYKGIAIALDVNDAEAARDVVEADKKKYSEVDDPEEAQ